MAIAIGVSILCNIANFLHTRHLHHKKIRQDYELEQLRDVIRTPLNSIIVKLEAVIEQVNAIFDADLNHEGRAQEVSKLQKEKFNSLVDEVYRICAKANDSKFIEGEDWHLLIELEIDKALAGFDRMGNTSSTSKRQKEGGNKIMASLQLAIKKIQTRIDNEAKRILKGKMIPEHSQKKYRNTR
ncbi:hypothetical protein WH95_02965 [Kiloniella litopenaei]|uniref:Uncharacterized protein n=1 Tax=Kiloniella litopenaei TaxID=1549748 RepID=A0A0M2R9E7_9PROT|nr:hypothetical protein [Kiloniella litopenaei]KKJ78286.1 hypothetical protein WH95_02965 [Kiloniella litopenaei]